MTDKYVLAPTDPVRDLAAGIVADVIAQGPLVQPPPPNLTIAPTADRGPAEAMLGPFTVTGDSGQSVTVAATGASMSSDAAGTTPIATNAVVPVGQQVWLRASGLGASAATLTATGVASVPTGNVFLYDGPTPGVLDAQRLILAESAQITVTAQATAEFFDTGSLQVSKTIDGPAAGQQGEIVIQVVCNEVPLADFVIPAGATGSPSTPTQASKPRPPARSPRQSPVGGRPAGRSGDQRQLHQRVEPGHRHPGRGRPVSPPGPSTACRRAPSAPSPKPRTG